MRSGSDDAARPGARDTRRGGEPGPRRVLLYDENGRVVLRADLANHQPVKVPNAPGDQPPPHVATEYRLRFPDTGTEMSFELYDVMPDNRGVISRGRGIVFNPDRAGVSNVIQLDEKDSLPASQLHRTVNDIHGRRTAEQQALAVRVTVWTFVRRHIGGAYFEVIVPIVGMRRRQPSEQLFQVIEQQRFVFVDYDGGSSVARLNVDHSVGDARLRDHCPNFVGQVNELQRLDGLIEHAFCGVG